MTALAINNPCPEDVAQDEPHPATIAKRFSAMAPPGSGDQAELGRLGHSGSPRLLPLLVLFALYARARLFIGGVCAYVRNSVTRLIHVREDS
jgi:hypothetical protein